MPIASHVAIRGSGDYVFTRILGFNQHNFRASAGVVFTLGGEIAERHSGPIRPRHEEAERWCADESEAPLLGVRGCSVSSGFRVNSVKRESAAERSGIGPGDILVAIDDRPIRDAREIETAIASSAGATVRVSYLIKGSWKTDRDVKVK